MGIKKEANTMRYHTYAEALVDRFGEKVYKIPVSLPLSCPNRDGTCGVGGCTFCGEVGTGFENLDADIHIAKQLEENMAFIGPKYKAKKFIAYFNNFTNTYCATETLEQQLKEACIPGVVGLCISTRPDCISDEQLEVMSKIQDKYQVEISIELGLQSINYHTLEKLNRGHGLAEFVDAVLRIKQRGFRICAHLIGNLPWDSDLDLEEAARLFTVLGIDEVKIHTLYILKNTVLAEQYLAGEFEMEPVETYVNRVVSFIRLVSPNMVFQRFAGRAPEEETLFCNWGMSWWRVKDLIDEKLEAINAFQGDHCGYTNGPALKKFNKNHK
jgi:hypothetical protein